jgi:RHS repeat-associated protein
MKSQDAQSSFSGTLGSTRQYDAFGQVVGSTGTWTGTWTGPFGHAGGFGYQEDNTGLQLLGHRYYDPSTGRFLTRDPIKDGRNWYAYGAGNGDPLGGVDPTGLSKGHHLHPKQIWKDRVSKEAASVFASAGTGGPIPEPAHKGYSNAHRAYNAAVRDLWEAYLEELGIDPRKMTAAQARAFINRILLSKDPRITGFLAQIYAALQKPKPKPKPPVSKPSRPRPARIPIRGGGIIGLGLLLWDLYENLK